MAFKVTIAIMLACLVAIGGYLAYGQYHASRCSDLEDAYLNGRFESGDLVAARMNTSDPEERARLRDRQDRNSDAQVQTILALTGECGPEALETADRKATAQLGF